MKKIVLTICGVFCGSILLILVIFNTILKSIKNKGALTARWKIPARIFSFLVMIIVIFENIAQSFALLFCKSVVCLLIAPMIVYSMVIAYHKLVGAGTA